MPYSLAADIENFLQDLGPNPLFVCDLDGNVMTGYRLAPNRTLPLRASDNFKSQNIPFDTSPKQLAAWVEEGIVVESIFAEKAMDGRLPADLVAVVNKNIADGKLFALTFLTSRSAPDALKLFKESGVTDPERVTLVADSGATIYLNGVKTEVRKLSADEKKFLSVTGFEAAALKSKVQTVLSSLGLDVGACPDLYIEHKGIATNVHYREVLTAFGQQEGSALDKSIGAALKTQLTEKVAAGPKDGDGKATFMILDGPATVEVKIAKINKGHGLAALASAAMASPAPPSAIIFSGDDIANSNGTPGTDYDGMMRTPALRDELGVPVFNVHTHHPVDCDLNGTVPDPHKSPETLSLAYPKPIVDLTLRTPAELAAVILKGLRAEAAPALVITAVTMPENFTPS